MRLILLERLPATPAPDGYIRAYFYSLQVFLLPFPCQENMAVFWDKLAIALSPTSAAPPWFYGIFFILIFAAIFKILPFGGLVDLPPPDQSA